LGILDSHLDVRHMRHCIDFLKEERDPYHLEDVKAYFEYRKCFLPRSSMALAV
jgi:hypothetical protein